MIPGKKYYPDTRRDVIQAVDDMIFEKMNFENYREIQMQALRWLYNSQHCSYEEAFMRVVEGTAAAAAEHKFAGTHLMSPIPERWPFGDTPVMITDKGRLYPLGYKRKKYPIRVGDETIREAEERVAAARRREKQKQEKGQAPFLKRPPSRYFTV